MNDDVSEIPFLRNIGLMLTYKCSVACPHCIVDAGPHRKEEMHLKNALNWINQAHAYRDGYIKGLALTGGEAFFNIEHLQSISAQGEKLGFVVSVVTNAFWASSKNIAVNILSTLPAIQLISISTDEYHQKAIPFDNIRNAVWAAKELGLLYNIAVCTDNKENLKYREIMKYLLEITEPDKIRTTITLPVGRGRKKSETFKYKMSSEPTLSACTMVSSPIIFPDGKVIACIGPVIKLPPPHHLFLGNLHDNSLSEILDNAEINPILHAIRIWGPQKIVSLLKEQGLDKLLPKEYITDCICDICYKLFSNDRMNDVLNMLSDDERFKQKVAYARVYYLKETRMVEMCQLTEST